MNVISARILHSSLGLLCFMDPASTDIYSYLHPLSLHDALPISLSSSAVGEPALQRWLLISIYLQWIGICSAATLCWARRWLRYARAGVVFFVCRSEEHTSELQSLMRISYAVFCLKKKKKKDRVAKNISYKNTYITCLILS